MTRLWAALLLTIAITATTHARLDLPPITPPLPDSSPAAASPQDTYILILITPDGSILRARGGIAEKNPLKPVFRDAHYGTAMYPGYFAMKMAMDPTGTDTSHNFKMSFDLRKTAAGSLLKRLRINKLKYYVGYSYSERDKKCCKNGKWFDGVKKSMKFKGRVVGQGGVDEQNFGIGYYKIGAYLRASGGGSLSYELDCGKAQGGGCVSFGAEGGLIAEIGLKVPFAKAGTGGRVGFGVTVTACVKWGNDQNTRLTLKACVYARGRIWAKAGFGRDWQNSPTFEYNYQVDYKWCTPEATLLTF